MKDIKTHNKSKFNSQESRPFFSKNGMGNSVLHAESSKPFFSSSVFLQRKPVNPSTEKESRKELEDSKSEKKEGSLTDNQFIKCEESSKTVIQEHYNRAIIQLSAAITRLTDALENINNKILIDNYTKSILLTYFKTADKDDIETILENFKRLDNKMVTGVKFKCVDDDKICPGTAGYVNVILPTSIHVGPVHICTANYKNESSFNKTKVIIHEAAHRFINVRDKAYVGRGFGKLEGHPKLAMNNADSYAWFAMYS